MKLALNSHSVNALRELADAIPMTIDNLTGETEKLIAAYQSVSDELGVHRNEFQLMLMHTQKALVNSREALEVLPQMMHRTADKIEAYIAAEKIQIYIDGNPSAEG